MSKTKRPARIECEFIGEPNKVRHNGYVRDVNGKESRGKILEPGDVIMLYLSELDHPQGRTMFEAVKPTKKQRKARTEPKPEPTPIEQPDTAEEPAQ